MKTILDVLFAYVIYVVVGVGGFFLLHKIPWLYLLFVIGMCYVGFLLLFSFPWHRSSLNAQAALKKSIDDSIANGLNFKIDKYIEGLPSIAFDHSTNKIAVVHPKNVATFDYSDLMSWQLGSETGAYSRTLHTITFAFRNMEMPIVKVVLHNADKEKANVLVAQLNLIFNEQLA